MGKTTPEELAQFVADKAKRDPKVRAVVQDVRMYDGLAAHQGWRHLRKKIAEQRDRFALNIARQILARGEVDQREIDFMHGYICGAAFVIERPEVAERNLEAAARLAAAFAKEELEATGEESPYA